MESVLRRVDHLVYGTTDLDAAIDRLEKLLGVRATPGGRHPGLGTRNALIALGPASYLEIIAPDPAEPAPEAPRPFGIDDLGAPRLATWAARGSGLEELVRSAAARGVMLGEVLHGSRRRPDGTLLDWRFTDPRRVLGDGLVPFFIDWGESAHPAETAARGTTLVDLRAEHPEPERVQAVLRHLGLGLAVEPGARPALVATVRTALGRAELR